MVGPYPVEDVIEQLRQASELKLVGGASDLEAARKTPPNVLPAAYVLAEEQGLPDDGFSELLTQRIRVLVKVVLWVRHAGAAKTGAAAARRMTQIEKAARKRLLGFAPEGTEFEPLRIDASGADQGFGDLMLRQLHMLCEYTATGEPT